MLKVGIIKSAKGFYSKIKYKKIVLLVLVVVLAIFAVGAFFLVKSRFIKNQSADLEMAYTLFESGNKEKAIKLLERRYFFNNADKEIATQLAGYYFKNKQYAEFEKISKEAGLNSSPDYTMLAYVARSSGETDKAISYYEQAIKAAPRSPSCYADLANLYQVLGQKDKAFDTVKEGLNNAPKSSVLNLLAANFSLDIKDDESAKKYASLVLEIDQDNQKAKEILNIK